MSEEILNDVLSKNFSYGYQWTYNPFNSVFKNSNGSVVQVQKHSQHDWLTYSIPWTQLTNDDKDDLFEFLQAIGWDEESFLLQDETGGGWFAERNKIGEGDGIETVFQLADTKTKGSASKQFDRWEIVNDVSYPVLVWVAGSPTVSGWSVNYVKSGEITFTSPPAIGADIETEFYFYRRCRMSGSSPFTRSDYELNNTTLGMREEGPDGQN